MNLDDKQKKAVTQWIDEGLKLAEIQKRLDTEFGLRVTYMDVRLLVDDLKLTPKDPEPPKQPEKPAAPAPAAAGPGELPEPADEALPEPAETPVGTGNVSVSVDTVTRPGALVSGNVTFSDGQNAVWYLDQMGRLGLAPKQQGYRPSPVDLQTFQMELQKEMEKLGY
jgi:hypothetical protein